MKSKITAGVFLLAWLAAAWCLAEQPASSAPSVSELLKQIQKKYDCGSFTAHFEQVSTLKALDISETASGQAYFKEPGMMRWEYVKPEPQWIITDGKKLWIFKPQENQVMIGEAPALFGEGQGVNFLSAIRTIGEKNQVTFDPDRQKEGVYALKLVPLKKTSDLSMAYFYVSRQTGLVEVIETVNAYEDTTRITFSDISLGGSIDAAEFTFEVPVDADIMMLDNPE